jgi:hypothetical protein
MKKKIVAGGAAAGLILVGAASAALLDTTGVSPTLAAGDVTVNGAVLEKLSFGTAWAQDFSTNTSGIIAEGGRGTITLEDGHAIVNGSAAGESGPFTRFGGYTSTSAGPWTASVDVYLDPAAPTQFDYSVAANGANGEHLQDFIFHAAVTSDGLTVGASNNSGFKPATGITGHKVETAGWHTLQHTFRPNTDGDLEVEMTLVRDGVDLWSKVITASGPVDFATTGHRYGWFTFTDGDLKIDNLALDSAEPQRQIDTMTVEVDKANSWIVASFNGISSKKVQANGSGVAVIDMPGTAVEDLGGPIHLVVTS